MDTDKRGTAWRRDCKLAYGCTQEIIDFIVERKTSFAEPRQHRSLDLFDVRPSLRLLASPGILRKTAAMQPGKSEFSYPIVYAQTSRTCCNTHTSCLPFRRFLGNNAICTPQGTYLYNSRVIHKPMTSQSWCTSMEGTRPVMATDMGANDSGVESSDNGAERYHPAQQVCTHFSQCTTRCIS